METDKFYMSYKIEWFSGRPVRKVAVIEEKDSMVTFETDYPVAKITIPSEEFHRKFVKW